MYPHTEVVMNKESKHKLEATFQQNGFTDFRWIDPNEIVVSQWVRMKCIFGCDEYGRNASCPPNTPSIPECERFFREYGEAAVFHFSKQLEDPDERHQWTRQITIGLLKLERQVFISGYPKTFLLPMDSCCLCKSCADKRTKCKNPKQARPTPESMGMDVFQTVRKIGYTIEVLSDYKKCMNRYAFLMVT